MQNKYVLPKMEHKFSIQIRGEESGLNWIGDFLYRRPTLRERSAIDALHKRLNGDLTTLNEDVAALNEALAFLRFTLKDYPTWWKDSDSGFNLYDANVIIELYNKCSNFEAEWRKKLMGGDPEKVKEDGNAEELELATEARP